MTGLRIGGQTWAGVLGVACLIMQAGIAPLIPTNLAWMAYSDLHQHYLGWAFFRHQPLSSPMGALPQYGLEQQASLIGLDSNQLLAFLFRPIAPLLPEPFQYIGIWLIVCYALFAIFAWKLLSDHTKLDGAGKSAAVALLCFTPMLMFRADHCESLIVHWVVLASLWVFLRPPEQRRVWSWPLMLFIVSLFSLYFFLLAACIWAADWGRRLFERYTPISRLALEAIAAPALVVLGLWQTGFFMLSGGGSVEGLGHFRADVFTFFDPYSPFPPPSRGEFTGPIRWSYFMPDIPNDEGHNGEYEGFAFFGVGLMALVAGAAWLAWRTRRDGALLNAPHLRYLVIVVLGLALFAVSNHISFGALTVDSIVPFAGIAAMFGLVSLYVLIRPHQDALIAFGRAHLRLVIAGVALAAVVGGGALFALLLLSKDQLRDIFGFVMAFRSSGRFISALFYTIALLAIIVVAKRLAPRQALLVLTAALVVQVADTSAGWLHMRSNLNRYGDSWQTKLEAPFWETAAARYGVIRQDWGHPVPNPTDFGLLAYHHGASTDIIYLVRENHHAMAASEHHIDNLVANGGWDRNTLYVLDPRDEATIAAQPEASEHALLWVDGLLVLAPGWAQCADCPAPETLGARPAGLVR